jgi:hypothetical protein
MSDSTWIRIRFDQIRVNSLRQKFEKVRYDDHDQDKLEHDLIENRYSNSRRSNRHTFEMRFTRTKNSRKNDETKYDFDEAVEFHLKSNLLQNSSVVHQNCSHKSHLRRLCLTHAHE